MAGTPLFKRGRHPSRDGIGRASIKADAAGKLRAEVASLLEKRITDADFQRLLGAILLAKADSGNVRGEGDGVMNHVATYFGSVTGCDVELVVQECVVAPVGYDAVRRKDIVAQLRAMTKLADDALISALRDCDIWTFQIIKTATTDLIRDQLWEHGQFTDSDGETYRYTSNIEFGSWEHSPYLPLGISGVRQAVERALAGIQGVQTAGSDDFRGSLARMPVLAKGRGAKAKPYQLALASECVAMWRLYGHAGQRKPSTASRTGKGTKIVDFAAVVFLKAGMPLSSRRLVALLKDARSLRAKRMSEGRRFAAKMKLLVRSG